MFSHGQKRSCQQHCMESPGNDNAHIGTFPEHRSRRLFGNFSLRARRALRQKFVATSVRHISLPGVTYNDSTHNHRYVRRRQVCGFLRMKSRKICMNATSSPPQERKDAAARFFRCFSPCGEAFSFPADAWDAVSGVFAGLGKRIRGASEPYALNASSSARSDCRHDPVREDGDQAADRQGGRVRCSPQDIS